MSTPKRVDLTPEEIDGLIARLEAQGIPKHDVEVIRNIAESLKFLYEAVAEKGTTIQRLRRMLFGDTTETLKNIMNRLGESSGEDSTAPEGGSTQPAATDPAKKRKGHGRNGASALTGATRTRIPHPTLKPGDHCPACKKGRVSALKEPGVLVRFTAVPPIQAAVTELEGLRCSSCQEVFRAAPPEGMSDEKYDETCVSMIATLKYGTGMPFKRIETLQESMGVPLPASTQWEIVAPAADRVFPAYEALMHEAAQGQVIHNDDTPMDILELRKKEEDKHELDAGDAQSRRSVFTSGIVSQSSGRKIALFFTGQKHAGENLAEVLKRRCEELGPPVQMCDALSRNAPEDFKVILANCIAHGRRRFVELAQDFPEETLYVLEKLRDVYRNDAKTRGMTPEERLAFHQRESRGPMDELHAWFEAAFAEKRVEENSNLGRAITYMLKHWDALTLFLKHPGAPLDNNLCERALKKAILHRKNSFYYRSENGARVGDIFMSLIHTCALNGVNPFEYLNALQRHGAELSQHPEAWLPWNYSANLVASGGG